MLWHSKNGRLRIGEWNPHDLIKLPHLNMFTSTLFLNSGKSSRKEKVGAPTGIQFKNFGCQSLTFSHVGDSMVTISVPGREGDNTLYTWGESAWSS